ncbi:hypothetical protein KJ656_08875, partial [bacterium]|nr:hypothetical protein [bacterium]
FSLPDSLLYNPTDSVAIDESLDPGMQSLRIEYNNQDKTIYWFLINSYPLEYNRILRITTVIKDILKSDPEYQSLPEPSGGYI